MFEKLFEYYFTFWKCLKNSMFYIKVSAVQNIMIFVTIFDFDFFFLTNSVKLYTCTYN